MRVGSSCLGVRLSLFRASKIFCCERIIRLEAKRFLQLRDPLRELALAEIEDAEIIINGGSLWIEPLGREIMHFRALDIAFQARVRFPNRNGPRRNFGLYRSAA